MERLSCLVVSVDLVNRLARHPRFRFYFRSVAYQPAIANRAILYCAHSVTLNPNRQPAYIVERWLIRFQLSVFYLNILVRIIPLTKLPFLLDGFRWSIKTAEFICIFCFCISAAFAKSFKVVFCFYHVRRFSTLLGSSPTVLVIHWFYLLLVNFFPLYILSTFLGVNLESNLDFFQSFLFPILPSNTITAGTASY